MSSVELLNLLTKYTIDKHVLFLCSTK